MIRQTTLILLCLSIFCFRLSAQSDVEMEVTAAEMPYFSGCDECMLIILMKKEIVLIGH